MKVRILVATALVASLVVALAPGGGVAAPRVDLSKLQPISGTPFMRDAAIPRQPSVTRAARIAAAAATTESQCIDSTETLVLTIAGTDPDNPLTQDVVFHLETPPDAPGRARIWVAWDYLATDWGPPDPIECDQVAGLQTSADEIVDTDVHYFGDYGPRGEGGQHVDILTYNIVDEFYFNPDATQFTAGFYAPAFEEEFDRNIFFLDSLMWQFGLGANAIVPFIIEGTFAHELVHLIMEDHDPDEFQWINEGLAELAIYLNGFGHDDGAVALYLEFHRDSLTGWNGLVADYGATYLFQLYLLENFGTRGASGVWQPGWTRAFMDDPAHGIASVENMTGMSFKDLFDAWVLANLQDTPARNARAGLPMGYHEIDLRPYVSPDFGAWSIRRAIKETYGADVNGNLPLSRYFGGATSGTVEFPIGTAEPYSPIYKSYGGARPRISINFRGESESGVLPPDGAREVHSGDGALLTDRILALQTPVGGTLTFQTWYQIEEEWDFGFVEASTDGGATWTKLQGSITRTSSNPNGSTAWANALGDAASSDVVITGDSGGWVEASFELPAASGVLVRFNYYTDEFFEERGWFIDQVEVDGVSESFESGAPDWDLDGWSITTGLFRNDWVLAFVNPKKSVAPGIGYVDPVDAGDGFQRSLTRLDTTKLNSDRVVVVFSNRPAEDAFEGGYLILVRKKG